MKKLIIALLFAVIAIDAQARWSCELECHISEDQEVGKIPRHASGTDYSDFDAECKLRKGTSTFPGYSGCDYVYCKVYNKRTDLTSGYGETLTEARQNARVSCHPISQKSCGLLNVRTIGNYKCSEY